MRERPILFSAPMVAAILAGRKTQTRRILKPQPPPHDAVYAKCGDGYTVFADHHSPNEWRVGGPVSVVRELMGNVPYPTWRCPYGAPGDRLWGREAFIAGMGVGGVAPGADPNDPEAPTINVIYRADDGPNERSAGPWTPSIHMPRWASRLLLEVVEVRVQRLQEIGEADARAEGVEAVNGHPERGAFLGVGPCFREGFAQAWADINGHSREESPPSPRSWAANPWVWCISFRRVEGQA